MSAPDPTQIDDGFGHWLAGFIDGEGCFIVSHQPIQVGGSPICYFILALRDDDADIVLEMHRRTGLGKVTYRDLGAYSGSGSRGNTKPQVMWRLGARRDCLALIRILDRYPLRAKKARDYAIWREAVLECERLALTQRPGHRDYRRVWALRDEMRRVREYSPRSAQPVELPEASDGAQLRMAA